MSDLPSRSPIQFCHLPNGQVQLAGRPDVRLMVHQDQATATFPAWERQLGLPIYQEQWEAWAHMTKLSHRYTRFILCDQSETKFECNHRWQPSKIRLLPGKYLFTLGHTGFVIGLSHMVTLVPSGPARGLLDVPEFAEGDCLIGLAELYDSRLANAAWRGLQVGIFSHTCAVVGMRPDDPAGAGELIEIALVSGPEAGCQGAQVLKWWEA